MNDMNERERDNGKIERKENSWKKRHKKNMFGNCNKILYRFTLPLISSLKYAPVTSCDVEESFSMFKNVQSEKRTSINENNLEKLVVHCFIKNKNVK